jgi:WD40 repeat protein
MLRVRLVLAALGVGVLAAGVGDAPARTGEKTAPDSGPALRELFGVKHLAYAPDGKSLLIEYAVPLGSVPPNTGKSAIGVWDVKTGQFRVGMEKVPDHCEQIALSPDGRKAAAVSAGRRQLQVWDTGTGKLLEEFQLPEWKGSIQGAPFLTFSPDGKSLTTVAGKKIVRAKLGGKAEVLADDLEFWAPERVAFAPATDLLVFAYNPPIGQKGDSRLKVFDLTKPGEPQTVTLPGWVRSIAFSKDGKTLAVSYEGGSGKPGKVELWDAPAWKVRAALPPDKRKEFWSYRRLYFSPDGKLLAGWPAFGDRSQRAVELLDLEGKIIREISDAGGLNDAAFSPDGKTVVIAIGNKPLLFLDPSTGKETAP